LALDIIAEEIHEAREEYFSNYITIYNKAQYKVQIKIHKPIIVISKTKVATQALVIYTLCSHVRMSQYLML
jgi:hypothetical protein